MPSSLLRRSIVVWPSSCGRVVIASRRAGSTSTSTSLDFALESQDPLHRILPPLFPTPVQLDHATQLLVKHAGSDADVQLAVLPFWTCAYTFHADLFYYLPQPDGSLTRHALPGHPFLVSVDASASAEKAFESLQFSIPPSFFAPSTLSPSMLRRQPIDKTGHPDLSLPDLLAQPPEHSAPFGRPYPFEMGPPRPRLVPLRIAGLTGDGKGKKASDMFTKIISAAQLGQTAMRRALFPLGGSMARLMDRPVPFDRLVFPRMKPLLIAYDTSRRTRPLAAVDPSTMTLQRFSPDGSERWENSSTSLHRFQDISPDLKTAQFTDAQIITGEQNAERLDWSSHHIHSLRPDRRRALDDLGNNLSTVRSLLTDRLTNLKSGRSKPILADAYTSSPILDAEAKRQSAEGLAERQRIAADQRKRAAEAEEVQQRMLHDNDLKRARAEKQRLKREASERKFQEAKLAKARRAEERSREEEKRRRLEAAMKFMWEERGARQSSSKFSSLSSAKVVHDVESYYRTLGMAGLSTLPDDAAVKAAYRQQMQLFHPDRPGGSKEKASLINVAFEKLQTEQGREMYQRRGFFSRSPG